MPRGGQIKQENNYKFPAKPENGYPSVCLANGCERESVGRGLCGMHYARAIRSGNLDTKWRGNTKHPLYNIWLNLKNSSKGGVVSEWNNFSTFLEDVGNKPIGFYRSNRSNKMLPYGPDNFNWKEIKNSENTHKSRWLRNKYGISSEEYKAMLISQNGVCAICSKPETTFRHGSPQALSVDHDHTNGGVRGLLCAPCNRGLGSFLDNPLALRNAADYLEKSYAQSNNVINIGEKKWA